MVQIGVQRIDRFLFLSELDGVEVSFFFSFQLCFDVLYEVDQRLHHVAVLRHSCWGKLQ